MYKTLSLLVACLFSLNVFAFGGNTKLSNCSIKALQPQQGVGMWTAEFIIVSCTGGTYTLQNSVSVDYYNYTSPDDKNTAISAAKISTIAGMNQGQVTALMMHNTAMIAFVKGFKVAVEYEVDSNNASNLLITKISMCKSLTTCDALATLI